MRRGGASSGGALYSELYDLYARLEPSPAYQPSADQVARIKERIEKLEAEIAEFIAGLQPKLPSLPDYRDRERWLAKNPKWAETYVRHVDRLIQMYRKTRPNASAEEIREAASEKAWDTLRWMLQSDWHLEQNGRPRE